jgi:hypothetical protein
MSPCALLRHAHEAQSGNKCLPKELGVTPAALAGAIQLSLTELCLCGFTLLHVPAGHHHMAAFLHEPSCDLLADARIGPRHNAAFMVHLGISALDMRLAKQTLHNYKLIC